MKKWTALKILGAASFVMTLDQAVMNVSISNLVTDLHTSVTSIQGVITLYSLVMAMCMVTGGKIGDRIGRRRAFVIGLMIYGTGSLVTALAPNVVVLAIGWSGLEGIGAALVLPALAALIASNYDGAARAVAYSVIGGVAGVAIAVGPILGGWATTELSWRAVFYGEVVIVLAILATRHLLTDAATEGRVPKVDGVGAVLVGLGLGLVVLGILKAGTWGWLEPRNSPAAPLGFSLVPYVVALGGAFIVAFFAWQRHQVARERDPLIHVELLDIPSLRAGLLTMSGQMLILMGVFFTIPLYLQLVLGLDALQTGVRMLPVSIAMFLASVAGARLAKAIPVRTVVQMGMAIVIVAALSLMATIQPSLHGTSFAIAMAALGLGMGLVASQLGNVILSSVEVSGRGEAGGLQYTAQQLGSALGVAIIGVVVLSGLVSTFTSQIAGNPAMSAELATQIRAVATNHASFVPVSAITEAAGAAHLSPAATSALVDAYGAAQLHALKIGLFAAAGIGLVALTFTRRLPSQRRTD